MEETEAPREIVDVREDAVFCPMTETKQAPKTCYFLRQSYMECVGDTRVPDPPPVVHASLSTLCDGQGGELPQRTKLWSSFCHSKGWVEWVSLMEPLHHETWKKVGIFDAIKCSTYRVVRDYGLLVALVEKWSCDTNTFVFSWGEATVTLEDVYVLGAYPVRGSPIFSDEEDGEVSDSERRMILARLEICRGPARNANSGFWMKMFKGSGSDIEHEAFLAFWLSRFVFMEPRAKISVKVFPLATRLARGKKIALAPAVLAGIYRDLSLAAKVIRGLAAPSGCGDVKVGLPSNVLQVWAWERFVFLQTRPKEIALGDPRIHRWDGVRNLKLKQAQIDLDMNISGCFECRPYVKDVENFKRPGFYPEEGRMEILDGDNLEDEIWVFARCLVPCELVGIDCIEQYLPHRVAMQFGLDQDIPGHVARFNENPRVAWETYDISFCGSSLYIPPRYYKPGMSERYRDWLGSRALKGHVERSKESAEDDEDSFPPGFPPVPLGQDVDETNSKDDDDRMTLSQLRSKTRKSIAGKSRASDCGDNLSKNNKGALDEERDEDSFPPGFPPVPLGQDVDETNSEDDDDRMTLSQLRSKTRKSIAGKSRASDCGDNLSKKNKGALDEETKGEITPTDPSPKQEDSEVENNNVPAKNPISEQEENPGRTASKIRSTFEVDMLELELSARISVIERDVAAIKAARKMQQLMALERGRET